MHSITLAFLRMLQSLDGNAGFRCRFVMAALIPQQIPNRCEPFAKYRVLLQTSRFCIPVAPRIFGRAGWSRVLRQSDHRPDRAHQGVGFKRLGDVTVCTAGQSFDHGFACRLASEHDDGNVFQRRVLAQPEQDVKSIRVGQHHVQKNQVGNGRLAELGNDFGAVAGQPNLEPFE